MFAIKIKTFPKWFSIKQYTVIGVVRAYKLLIALNATTSSIECDHNNYVVLHNIVALFGNIHLNEVYVLWVITRWLHDMMVIVTMMEFIFGFLSFNLQYKQYVQHLLNFISVDFTSMTFELPANTILFVNVCFAKMNWQTCSTASASYGNFEWTNWPNLSTFHIFFTEKQRVHPKIIHRFPFFLHIVRKSLRFIDNCQLHLFMLKQSKEWIIVAVVSYTTPSETILQSRFSTVYGFCYWNLPIYDHL